MGPQKAKPDGAELDLRVFTCSQVVWEAQGRPAVAPAWLMSARPSVTLVNLGQKGWPLLVANQPAGAGLWATACPVGTTPGQDPAPASASFTITAKNLYGTLVARIVWQVQVDSAALTAPASRCIARLQAQTLNLSLSSGWKADLRLSAGAPLEALAGRASVALLPIRLELRLSSPLKDETQGQDFLAAPGAVYIS